MREEQLTELVNFIFKSGWCCYFNKEVESKGRIKQAIVNWHKEELASEQAPMVEALKDARNTMDAVGDSLNTNSMDRVIAKIDAVLEGVK
jgi:phage terminase Nu1 subunit (DNA packaging protein)